MTTSEQLFLLLAEELNFSKTAKTAFISQQCLSDHIKRLEAQYGTKLFHRKPKVELTEAGKIVQNALIRIRSVEMGMHEEICKMENGNVGSIRIALNYTRSKIIIPKLFSKFYSKYPRVQLEISVEQTRTMQEMIRKGTLDCFLGTNGKYDDDMEVILLSSESLYLVATNHFLKTHTTLDPDKLVNGKTECDLKDFQNLPFIGNHKQSTAFHLINQMKERCGIVLNEVLFTDDYEVSEGICRTGTAASIFPELMIPPILRENLFYEPDYQIYALPIRGLQNSIQFCLVKNRFHYYPLYAEDFFRILKNVVHECLLT